MVAVAGLASRAMRRLLSGSEIACTATGCTFRARSSLQISWRCVARNGWALGARASPGGRSQPKRRRFSAFFSPAQVSQSRLAVCPAGADLPRCNTTGQPDTSDLARVRLARGRRKAEQVIPTSWATHFDACIDCCMMDGPHRAHERCKRCDDYWRYYQGAGY